MNNCIAFALGIFMYSKNTDIVYRPFVRILMRNVRFESKPELGLEGVLKIHLIPNGVEARTTSL